jgi:hypothetical protein
VVYTLTCCVFIEHCPSFWICHVFVAQARETAITCIHPNCLHERCWRLVAVRLATACAHDVIDQSSRLRLLRSHVCTHISTLRCSEIYGHA